MLSCLWSGEDPPNHGIKANRLCVESAFAYTGQEKLLWVKPAITEAHDEGKTSEANFEPTGWEGLHSEPH